MKAKPPPARGAAVATAARCKDGAPNLAPAIADDKTRARQTLTGGFEDLLAGRWPGDLRRLIDFERPVPLAIGIGAGIADAVGLDAEERVILGRLMRGWCGTIGYLEAVAHPRSARVGLDGQPVEPVSPGHRAWARKCIRRKRERLRARMSPGDVDRVTPEPAPASEPAGHRFPVLRLPRPAL